MSFPSFEDEIGANAPWYQMPFVIAFWILAMGVAWFAAQFMDAPQEWDGHERRRPR